MIAKWLVEVDGERMVFTTNDPSMIGHMAHLNAQHRHSISSDPRPYVAPQSIKLLGLA